jgi:ribosomal protein L7Ae-like RNA K-turn-binding protein
MKEPGAKKPVERLFPFVLRSRNLIVGRDTLARSKSKLHFVLITSDLSETSRGQILQEFSHYPVVQRYSSEDLGKLFGIKGAKVVGFQKSGIAKSLYAELKEYRINLPTQPLPQPPQTNPIPLRDEKPPGKPIKANKANTSGKE